MCPAQPHSATRSRSFSALCELPAHHAWCWHSSPPQLWACVLLLRIHRCAFTEHLCLIAELIAMDLDAISQPPIAAAPVFLRVRRCVSPPLAPFLLPTPHSLQPFIAPAEPRPWDRLCLPEEIRRELFAAAPDIPRVCRCDPPPITTSPPLTLRRPCLWDAGDHSCLNPCRE